MTRVIAPAWLREEINEVVKKQMALARMLQARLVDHDRRHELQVDRKVKGTDIVAAVMQLDASSRHLSQMIGGCRALKENEDCMRHTMEFNAYCDREFAYDAKR